MITMPFAYTRRFFEKDEVIISSCNYCYAAVGESSDEAELEAMERQHSCAEKAKALGEQQIARQWQIAQAQR